MNELKIKNHRRRARAKGAAKLALSCNAYGKVVYQVKKTSNPKKGKFVVDLDGGVVLVAHRVEPLTSTKGMNIVDEVRKLGTRPGVNVDPTESARIVHEIAANSLDLFSNVQEAESFLKTSKFGASGKTAEQLIREGRVTTVMARLGGMRFGYSG